MSNCSTSFDDQHMKMGKTAENQICSSLLCVAVLVPSIGFAYFLSIGFSPFLVTLAILILSTMFFIVKFKKKKVILDEKPVQLDEGMIICEYQKNLPGKEVGETAVQPPLETAFQTEAALQHEVGLMHEYQVESDSESSNDSVMGEKFDLDLICSNYMEQNLAISDVSVSDEDDDDDDSLIEISLPGSKFGGLDEEVPKQKPQSNLPVLLPESIFEQQGLMELLAEINEMNEEENLIEIDLGIHQAFKVSD